MIALISDTHFGVKNHNKKIFSLQLDFFEKFFFPFILENKIKNVIHLGDIVHNRNQIDLFILQELKTRFFKWFDENDIKLHLLIGNHDCFFRNRIDYSFQKENLNEFKNIIVYDEIKNVLIDRYIFGMVPWIVDEKKFEPPKKVDIICGHFEINEIQMMPGIISHSGIDKDKFKNYKLVFSGHYHSRSVKDNIYYIGTQYQLNWNDYNQDKGFYVLDEDFKLEFIKNNFNPKFIKIYYEEGEELKIKISGLEENTILEVNRETAIEIARNNFCKLFIKNVKDEYNLDYFYNSLCEVSNSDYKIEIINCDILEENSELNTFDEFLNTDYETIDLILNYIENVDFDADIDKNFLLDQVRLIYKESFDEIYSNLEMK